MHMALATAEPPPCPVASIASPDGPVAAEQVDLALPASQTLNDASYVALRQLGEKLVDLVGEGPALSPPATSPAGSTTDGELEFLPEEEEQAPSTERNLAPSDMADHDYYIFWASEVVLEQLWRFSLRWARSFDNFEG
mmetsp:Transcript_1357/g.3018  ORF Transcript_1357/g.3018 Transcript_1357/m.3018 type:complete len:138 (-) Transcript_1357:72-485(-)